MSHLPLHVESTGLVCNLFKCIKCYTSCKISSNECNKILQ